jgi:Spx/MgsR family transcriptional regulator
MAGDGGGWVLYGIANCDTVKKARAFADACGLRCRFHDFKKDGVPQELLARWLAEAGVDAIVNRKGTTWRRLDEAARASVVDAASAQTLLLAQPSAIKRPLLMQGERLVAVGFDAGRWGELLRG